MVHWRLGSDIAHHLRRLLELRLFILLDILGFLAFFFLLRLSLIVPLLHHLRVRDLLMNHLRMIHLRVRHLRVGHLRMGHLRVGHLRVRDLLMNHLRMIHLRVGHLRVRLLRVGHLRVGNMLLNALMGLIVHRLAVLDLLLVVDRTLRSLVDGLGSVVTGDHGTGGRDHLGQMGVA